MRQNRLTTIRRLALLIATASAPLGAHAFSLQDCDPTLNAAGNPNAQLPIGQLGDDGFGYRDRLRQFIASTLLADVAYPANWYPATTPFSDNTPYWQAGMIPYGPYTYVRGQGTLDANNATPNPNIYPTQCLTDLGNPGLQASEKQVLEQEFLLDKAGELVPDQWRYFMLDPGRYLIGAIEDRDACEARVPNLRHAANLTFMAQFEYAGNLFLGVQDQSQRRFAVYLALLLIQSDWAAWHGSLSQPLNGTQLANPYPQPGPSPYGEVFLHPGAPGANSYPTTLTSPAPTSITAAEGGARLVMMGRIYEWLAQTQPAWLTPSDMAAFEEGLARAGERIARLNLPGGQINRFYQSVHGLAAIKHALVGTQYHANATGWHDDALADFIAIFRPAGYFGDDDGRYDAAYNRYNIRHVIRSLMTDPGTAPQNVATLTAMAQRLGELEAHLILTDRTGIHTSPSAMSVRTGAGVAGRGLTVAASPQDAIGYLAAHDFGVPFAYARLRDLDLIGPFDHSTTLAQIDARSSNPDFWGELICRKHPNHDPFAWKPQVQPWPAALQTETDLSGNFWGYTHPHHEIEGYDTGGGSPLSAFADALDQTPSAGYLPIESAGPHLRNFDDEFVFTKFGGEGVYFEGSRLGNSTHHSYQANSPRDFAAIFHLGRVSTNHSTCGGQAVPRGFGGGQLAGLWSPGGGIFSMSRRRGYNNACDSWTNGAWRTLPMHAVTLVDTADRVATSARIAVPVVDTHFAAQPFSPTLPMDYLNHGPPALTGVPNLAPSAADTAFLQAEGDFSDQRYDTATGALVNVATPIHFRRRFVPYEDGMYVRTELIAQTSTIMPTHRIAPQREPKGQVEYPVPMPEVFEAWETLPINLTQGPTITGFVNTEITLKDTFGVLSAVPAPSPGAASTAWNNVTTVIITREDGTMVIGFDSPQTVAFSEDFQTFGGDTPSQNLLVDLTPSRVSSANINAASPVPDQLVPTALTYWIEFQ